MKYRFRELVDLDKVKSLMQSFYDLTHISSALLDVEGNILTTDNGEVLGVGWKDICLNFHRANPETANFCRMSDIELSKTASGKPPFYKCFNGMVDAAIPIVIDGEHLVNLFAGQFFLDAPDPDFFRRRAALFGFDEQAYMAALADVPVFSTAYIEKSLAFLQSLATMIAEMGLAQKRLLEELRKSEDSAEAARRAEQEAKQARESAEKANKARSRFFAAASHDLRQPIHALRLFVEVLQPGLEGTRHEAKIAGAAQALASAEMILHSLFDVARIEAGAITPAPRDIGISGLLTALANEFAPQAAAKGLTVRLRTRDCSVWSDPLMLERILRNLLANAVRYTERGGILLSCRRKAGAILLEVWDTGPGIAEEDLEKIWEEFFQVGNEARDRALGLGLGLSIARRLADCLGLRLGVRSRVGRGTVFQVEIPDR